MVDSISNKVGSDNNTLLNLISTDKADSTQAANTVSAASPAPTATPDTQTEAASDATTVTISDQARQAAASDKDVIKFSRLAQRDKTPFNTSKVATFKAMLDNGRINNYLSGLNTDQLAGEMLKSNKAFFMS